MYEYRKLNKIEKKEILRHRKERGFPFHSPPHFKKEAGIYLITAAIYEHKPILLDPIRRNYFLEYFFCLAAEIKIKPHAWVILPNHYHFMTKVENFNPIQKLIKQLHGKTSYLWNKEDGIQNRKIWFKYSDRLIRSDVHYHTTLNYIHFNPVKHGYVKTPGEWKWSSFELFRIKFGDDWIEKQMKNYPIGHYGKGWDD